jgi:hypothetical protein
MISILEFDPRYKTLSIFLIKRHIVCNYIAGSINVKTLGASPGFYIYRHS